MTTQNVPLGPGTASVGEIGTEVDISCLINNAIITVEKTQDDPETRLCGDQVAEPPVYKWTFEGTVDQDLADASGLHALSYSAKGTQIPFTYTPNTLVGATAAGVLIIDPLPFGGTEMGKTMVADFAWLIVGEPAIVYGTGAAATVKDPVDDLVAYPVDDLVA